MAKRVILLCGYGGVGKDTIRAMLEKRGYEGGALAAKVREMAETLDPYFRETQCTYNHLMRTMGYEAAKRAHPCVREFLVKLGHDCKKVLGEDIWIRLLRERVDASTKPFVISDCRYLEEVRAFPDAELWYIDRPGVGPANNAEGTTIPLILAECNWRFTTIHNDSDMYHLEIRVANAHHARRH